MLYTLAGLPRPPTRLSPPSILVCLPGEEPEYWTKDAAVTICQTMILYKVEWRDGDRTWFEWSCERPR